MRKIPSRGFSILEIMITLLILGVGFVAVTKVQGTTVKNSNLTAQRTEAINMAQAEIEVLRHFAYDFVATHNATHTNQLLDDMSTLPKDYTQSKLGNTASYTMSSSIKKSAALDNSMEISVVVTWPDTARLGAVSDDSTVAISTVINAQVPVAGVMSDSVPPLVIGNDPSVAVVLCACSGSTGSNLRNMSSQRPRLDFFIKTGGGGHNAQTTAVNDAICTSCCSLPAGSTKSLGGSHGGGGGSDYLCSVRKGKGHTRWGAW